MNVNFPKIDQKILRFWKKDKTFEKSVLKRRKAPDFVFYEGPPTANARPGLHHVLARAYKDAVCRYKTMRGFRVLRKAGWDTHGLPVELEIEKKLGLKSKKDIERYGIAKFNKNCRQSVWNYKKDWEKLTERIAFWLDMENPYITYMPDYIETVWWILKEVYKKGLLYQDYKVVPYCPRCGTSLSSHEVALGYEKIKEPAIYMKFEIKNPKFETQGKSYLLVWTTTPWTLPGNVAVAINPKFEYVEVKINNEYLILAKERLAVLENEYEVVKNFSGKDLADLRYNGLYPLDEETSKIAYKIIPADFVSLEEGTGLVHIAPAFGEEDMAAVKQQFPIPNFQFPIPVDGEGKFTLEVKKWAGMFVKDADPLIIEDLKERGLLFREELYEHDYPFCWRCKTPLLYYAKKSWFIGMTKVKKDLIENNHKINWIPAHLKKGRFGEWLKEVKDWALSRERYWGTPIPVWQCENCQNLEVIGSLKDLLSQKFSNNNYFILRHGESLRQIKKISLCWPEKIHCPLTKKGIEEVEVSAKKLKNKKIDLIFSSDLLRTKQSTEILAKETGAKIIFDKRLREYNAGTMNGKDPKLIWEFLEKKQNIISAKPPGGESFIEIKKRTLGFLNDINKKYKEKNLLIVSHEFPLTILEWSLLGWPLEKIIKLRKEKKINKIETGELRKIIFRDLSLNENLELDFHRPYIDKVKFYCQKCGNLMGRIPEVIDCWFDSGSMPFAQSHWPFAQSQKSKVKSQKLRPPKLFPADYISEAIDQTRGWFYTLLAISTLLGFKNPYKNVISLGHVLDEKGEKMSKSKGNIVDPWKVVEKYGADAIRWYFYTINQPGDSKLFSEKDIEESLRKFILTFWNCCTFFETYVPKKKFSIFIRQLADQFSKTKNVLDRWIISRLNWLIRNVTENLDEYDITGAARDIENFAVNDLSLWYIRRSRRRFQKSKTKEELKEVSQVLAFVLSTLNKLAAPFIPFLSEEIFQKLKTQNSKVKSIHLEDWPKVNKKLINNNLEKKMEKVRKIVAEALAERAKAKIKVRQPLSELRIENFELKKEKELSELIKEEVNVKEITFGKSLKLDTKITPELKEEGMVREIIRNIQEMRKQAGLKPGDKISVTYFGNSDLNQVLSKNKNFILKEAKVKNLILREKRGEKIFNVEKEIEVDNQKIYVAIKKI